MKEEIQPEDNLQSEPHSVESEENASGTLNPSLNELYFKSQDEKEQPKKDETEEDKKSKNMFKKIAPKKGKRPSEEKDESEKLDTPKDGKKLQDKEDDIKLREKKVIRRDVDDSQKDENADHEEKDLTNMATIIDTEKSEDKKEVLKGVCCPRKVQF